MEKQLDNLLIDIKNDTAKYTRENLILIEYLKEQGLIKDKSTNAIKSKQECEITIKGLLFEGFVNQKNRLNRLSNHKLIMSWAIAIGTSLAGIYALLQLFDLACNFFVFCHCP